NIVGDHATYHQKFDAPLESDIDALGKWVKGTMHRPASSSELTATMAAAVASANLGRIATLILPADLSWTDANSDAAAQTTPLSAREREIARLVSQGDTNRESAEKFTVSIRAVEGHLYRIAAKSGSPTQDEPNMPRPGHIDVADAAGLLKSHGDTAVLLLGGSATSAAGRRAAARISAATGTRALVETFPARLARGQGVP